MREISLFVTLGFMPGEGTNASRLFNAALALLRKGVGNSTAAFRLGQWEAIQHVLERRGPLLVVQKTGWGKSNVYFILTKLLREAGGGTVLLISPLLSLMRNQMAAAERMGVRAERITSEEKSREDWERIKQILLQNKVDILLISPERLANALFHREILTPLAQRLGMLVVDEAHCISDWGHDFRPDYRRITRILQRLPGNVPVLATTATANDRVITDLKQQLGALKVQRGEMSRPSLCLQATHLPTQAERLAWLAETLPRIPGSGIVYTLTVRDARIVAKWLKENGIAARPYWGGMDAEYGRPGLRENIEQSLLANRIKVLVATTALGMGFDKPDLSFVIHYQLPGSVIHYYQQVGRAGRALPKAYGILLCGTEDKDITDYFINSAFPPRAHVEVILRALNLASDGASLWDLQRGLNLRKHELDKALKLLSLESPSPVTKDKSLWKATAASLHPSFWERIERLTHLRRSEQEQMRLYANTEQCLMLIQARALDDPAARPCGRCANCLGEPLFAPACSSATLARAVQFLRQLHYPIPKKTGWPKGAFTHYPFTGKITPETGAEEGRALCAYGDSGWGEMVSRGKYETQRFDDALVEGLAAMIQRWKPDPFPAWVTCVPSSTHPELVADLAERLARRLGLRWQPCLRKVRATQPQKSMHNSFQQARNLDGAFAADPWPGMTQPVFLVDDMFDSGWTFAVASAVLKLAGSGPVFPVALAVSSTTDDT